MIDFFRYFRAQLLRARKLFPAVLTFFLAVVFCAAVLLTVLAAKNSSGEEHQHIRVGLVGDLSENYLNIGVFAIQNFDSSRQYLEFLPLEEPAAEQALRGGDITGFVRIPPGFVEASLRGDDVQVEYVAGSSPSSLGPLLMQEVADIISRVVIHAQSGVYGFLSLTGTLGTDAALRRELTDRLTLDYVQTILAREQVFSVEYLGYSAGLRFGDYYFCAFFLLTVLLCGLPCTGLLVTRDRALSRALCSRGLGALRQTAAEALPFFLMLAACALLLLPAAGAAFSAGKTGILTDRHGAGAFLRLGLSLLPAVLVLAAMEYFLCQLADSIISGVLLQVLTILVTAVASGYFLPVHSLPAPVQMLSGWLPTGVALQCAAGVLTGTGCGWLPILWTVGLWGLSALVRAVKIRSVTHDR